VTTHYSASAAKLGNQVRHRYRYSVDSSGATGSLPFMLRVALLSPSRTRPPCSCLGWEDTNGATGDVITNRCLRCDVWSRHLALPVTLPTRADPTASFVFFG
jgi:hypothetical protein